MTFAVRTLGYLARGASTSITVGSMSSVNTVNGNSFGWWGWSSITNTGTPSGPWLLYPDNASGSVSPSPYIVNGLTVLGVVSRSAPNGTVDAAVYYVYVSGNHTTGITTLTINGTTLTSPVATYDSTGQGSVSNTRFTFTRTDTTTLFGTTVGAKISVSIT